MQHVDTVTDCWVKISPSFVTYTQEPVMTKETEDAITFGDIHRLQAAQFEHSLLRTTVYSDRPTKYECACGQPLAATEDDVAAVWEQHRQKELDDLRTRIRTRIAAVAANHDYRAEGNDVDCRCGWNVKTPHWDDAQIMWAEHLADAVIPDTTADAMTDNLQTINQVAAFRETIETAERYGMPEMLGSDLGLHHLRSMLDAISMSTFSEAKLGRWLGWAQCAVVAANVGLTLDDMKALNLRHCE